MDYSDTATEGPWTASLNRDGKDAFATSYVWDGTEEGLRIEPGEIEGCFITRYGGYYGRGLPEPFSISIPNAYYVNEKDVPEDAEIKELEFTMVFGSQIYDLYCRQLAGYYCAKDEEGKDIYYLLLIKVELSPDNKNFKMENGKLYFKDKDTPIEELYFEPAKTNENSSESSQDAGKKENAVYSQISQDVAASMMEKDDGHVIVDVRREDEYAEGHIPGAILIPNESIGTEKPNELPDLDQIILVYCRSGRRSKEASQKLADMGYKNVYEFGGIIDWKGAIVTDTEDFEDMTPTAIMVVRVGERSFTIDLSGNSSAEAFWEKIKEGGLKIDMSDYGGFEKVGNLPWSLPTNDEEITTKPGDLILYQGNKLTVYYDENTWNFTKLGRLNAGEEEIKEVFGGKADIKAEFYLEWTE